jgi:hypothetical protein
MVLRRTVLDESVSSAWRRVAHLWRPMAGWTLLVWAALAAVLVPFSSAVLGRYLLRGDRIVVGNEELIAWALTPAGSAYLRLAGALAIVAAVVRYAGLFRIVTDDMEGRPASVRRTALWMAPRLPSLCAGAPEPTDTGLHFSRHDSLRLARRNLQGHDPATGADPLRNRQRHRALQGCSPMHRRPGCRTIGQWRRWATTPTLTGLMVGRTAGRTGRRRARPRKPEPPPHPGPWQI